MKRTNPSKSYGASSSPKKRQHTNKQLTKIEHAYTPVVSYALRTLYGFPFNNRAATEVGYSYKCIHQKYVDEIGIENLQAHDVLVVKSPMGSGKTSMFLKIIENYERVLIISSRRSYSSYMCTVVPGLVNYQSIKGPISAEEHPRVVIQVQSLRRIRAIKSETTYAQWDLVYIDEPNGVFKEIISPVTPPEERKMHAKYMRKVVSNISTVVITDAGLAPWHLEVINKHLLTNLTRRKKMCVINDYVPRSQRLRVFDSMLLTCSKYTSTFCPKLKSALGKEDSLMMATEWFFASKQESAAKDLFVSFVDKAYRTHESQNDIGDMGSYLRYMLIYTEENIVVICNTKAQASLVSDYVKLLLGENAIVLLTSETPSDVKAAFIADPKNSLIDKRVLCHTTCVNVGVDFNFQWSINTFVVVDCLDPNYTPSVIDIYQGIGRNRRATTINLFVNRRRVNATPKEGGSAYGRIEDNHMDAVTTEVPTTNPTEEASWKPTLWNGFRLLSDISEDTLDAVVYSTNKLEKSFNRSPRLFFDILVSLLKTTSLEEGGIEYRHTSWEPNYEFFTEDADVSKAVKVCGKLFKTRITKFTSLTLQSFNDIFKRTPRSEKIQVLQDIVAALDLFRGNFATSYFVLRHINKHLLKQWAIKFNKLQYVEPVEAVDFLGYDKEAAVVVNPDSLVLLVKRRLFQNNNTASLKTFEEFESAVNLMHSIMDNGGRCQDDTDLEALTKLLVNQYEISTRRRTALENIAKATGLALYVEPGEPDDIRLIMPAAPIKVDIHKMAALMLL